MPNYEWIPFYKETAEKLLPYRQNRSDLIEKIKSMYARIQVKLPTLELHNELMDIDPFTVFGLFNRNMKLRPIASDRVKGSLSGWGRPRLMVRLPCGSPSISSTFFPACASPIPRFAQVVVLPTPPFWLAMAMICVFNDFTSFLIGVVMCLHSSPGNDKSRHSKQVTASPKSNILLCLKSKGFEFLSAIHLSLMKHPL